MPLINFSFADVSIQNFVPDAVHLIEEMFVYSLNVQDVYNPLTSSMWQHGVHKVTFDMCLTNRP